MIRLYTLKDISAFSSDSVYKICLAMDKYGLSEDTMESFESYEELFTATISSLEEGKHIIIAAETNDFIKVKRDLMAKLILENTSSSEIADAIAVNAGDDISEIDLEGHCLIPENSVYHLTSDGLYSGFTCDTISGKLSFIPLDFMRLDGVLTGLVAYKEAELIQMQRQESSPFAAYSGENTDVPEQDFFDSVGRMVSTLSGLGKKVALTTSEATMWVYNLYDRIEGLTETVNFVEISDSDTKSKENKDPEEVGEEDFEESLQEKDEQDKESESMRVIRHAREAMYNTDCDFGAAVSEVYTGENENGQTIHYAYVAVVDRSTAKAKKINTANPDDVPFILPHAVSILCDVVCQKSEVTNRAIAKIDYGEEKDEEKKADSSNDKKEGFLTLSKGMIAFAAVVLVFALISPMLMTYIMLKPQTTTTAPAPVTQNVVQQSYETTAAPTAPTTNPFAPTAAPATSSGATVTEPVAPEVSAVPTTASVASEKGVFTFYVFGYGHGVGMSQVGANYLATQGWTAAQILAHYYYDPNTSIVTGDAYPEKIKYAGTEYATREFLASALESEMGGSFQVEALKAQAIALYTFAKYNGFNLSNDATAFGKSPSQTVYSVIDDVMAGGYYIAHGSDVAVTPFHAMSAGVTTSYYNVWGKGIGASVPYLSGGRKSYGDYLDSNFKSVYTITSDDLKQLVKENANISLAGDPSTWLGIITHDSAVRDDIGYISSINVGGTIMTGNDFRIKVMGGRIRSHCFAFTYTPNA